MMKKLLMAGLGLALIGAPAAAAEFKVKLAGPERTVKGRGGLHAADSRTETSLVRVISPGSEITRRGTVRVLVMNLGTKPFVFGPEDVEITLSDGTPLKFIPYEVFDKGAKLVERESSRQASIGMRAATNFSELAAQGAGPSGVERSMSASGAGSPDAGGAAGSTASRLEDDVEVGRQPGAKMREIVESVMARSRLAPQEAAGGYLVFELPDAVRSTKADQKITVTVKAGSDEHRFEGVLERQ
jgi:hypothetical protein